MRTGGLITGAMIVVGLSVTALAAPGPLPQDGSTLAGVVPNDVFLFVAQQHDPAQQFLEDYWGEVFEALKKSGVGQDALDLLCSLLNAKQAAEVQRFKERATQLVAGVDWNQLVGREFVFAEQFVPPPSLSAASPPIAMPNMVWLLRGSGAGAAQNYEGLVAILQTVADEINRLTGSQALSVTTTDRMGTQVASVNLLAMLPGAPELPLSVGLHEDVIIVGLREHLFGDVLDLMGGKSSKKSLAADARFQAAFAQLPAAEDGISFFNVHNLLDPLRDLLNSALEMARASDDVYRNTEMSGEAALLNAQALNAYRSGDIKQALASLEKVQGMAPQNSIVLYNLACFNALLGNRDAALSWLEKAVEGGFYAPAKIASDQDLDSLRDDPRYKAALAKASELAATHRAEDVIINSSKTGEAYALNMQAIQAYEAKDYEQGLKLSEQAYAVAPKDSRVLYSLACFHALLGHQDKALEFLNRAVEGGFYCPQHIAKDPDLDSLRSDERYRAALTLARDKAAQLTSQKAGQEIGWVRLAVDKLADAVGILDCVAAVEITKDYSLWTESVALLVPDAQSKPVYPVLAGKSPLTEFDRYLPQETDSFSVSSGFSPQALYKFLEDSIREVGSPGEELLATWTEMQKKIGVDVQKDILDWIDGGFISVTLSEGRGAVWLLKVTDEQTAHEKVAAAIKFFSTKLPEVVGKIPALAPMAMMASMNASPLEREDLPGFESLQFAMSPRPVVWGTSGGYLVFGSSADAAALCLATARGEHPGIRQNARVMSEAVIPDGPFESVSLTDQRKLGEDLVRGIGMASMISGMMSAFVPEPKARAAIAKIAGMLTKLTPVVRKIDFYKSTASLTTFDGQKWRTRRVTHYFSPAERAARSVAPTTEQAAPTR